MATTQDKKQHRCKYIFSGRVREAPAIKLVQAVTVDLDDFPRGKNPEQIDMIIRAVGGGHVFQPRRVKGVLKTHRKLQTNG